MLPTQDSLVSLGLRLDKLVVVPAWLPGRQAHPLVPLHTSGPTGTEQYMHCCVHQSTACSWMADLGLHSRSATPAGPNLAPFHPHGYILRYRGGSVGIPPPPWPRHSFAECGWDGPTVVVLPRGGLPSDGPWRVGPPLSTGRTAGSHAATLSRTILRCLYYDPPWYMPPCPRRLLQAPAEYEKEPFRSPVPLFVTSCTREARHSFRGPCHVGLVPAKSWKTAGSPRAAYQAPLHPRGAYAVASCMHAENGHISPARLAVFQELVLPTSSHLTRYNNTRTLSCEDSCFPVTRSLRLRKNQPFVPLPSFPRTTHISS